MVTKEWATLRGLGYMYGISIRLMEPLRGLEKFPVGREVITRKYRREVIELQFNIQEFRSWWAEYKAGRIGKPQEQVPTELDKEIMDEFYYKKRENHWR